MAQLGDLICSGTSRFLNDTYTTNLHTNRIDVTTGSNYSSALTPYVWSIYSKQEDPYLSLILADSSGNIADQLWLQKDDIYVKAKWDGTNESLKTAVTNAKSKVKQENTTTDASYRLLLSHDANDITTDNVTAQKSAYIQFNPNKGALTIGTRGTGDVGTRSFTSGSNNLASGSYSAAIGYSNESIGDYSFTEGKECKAPSGAWYQHAEGQVCTAKGDAAHAEGCYTTAVGNYSHSSGLQTYASSKSQFVFGEYNEIDGSDNKNFRSTYVEIVGNGTADNARSDARRLKWTGDEWLAGALTTTDVIKTAKWDGTNASLKDAITAIYSRTLCYSASISRGSGWTQRSTSTAFPSSTTGTYLFMIKDSNGTIYSRIPVPATDFVGTTSTRPLIVRSNGTSSDANNIMAYWSSTTKFYTYAGSSSMPTGTFTLVVHYTPLNI